MGFTLPRRTKKRLPDRSRQLLDLATESNREYLALEIGTSIPSVRLIRVLNRLVDYYGTPDAMRLDNGPELVSGAFTEWAACKGIAIRYIQSGKPNQNALIERFNRIYPTEVLDAHLFASLEQVQVITNQWQIDYNEYRPYESLGGVPQPLLRISISQYLLDGGMQRRVWGFF